MIRKTIQQVVVAHRVQGLQARLLNAGNPLLFNQRAPEGIFRSLIKSMDGRCAGISTNDVSGIRHTSLL